MTGPVPVVEEEKKQSIEEEKKEEMTRSKNAELEAEDLPQIDTSQPRRVAHDDPPFLQGFAEPAEIDSRPAQMIPNPPVVTETVTVNEAEWIDMDPAEGNKEIGEEEAKVIDNILKK